MARTIRIGIDVGGTFTHAVAIDQKKNTIIAHSVTPTTHSSENSVSEGIIKVFTTIIEELGTDKSEIAFVAHSTTQATNALLEGDVSKVGIIGMGKGLEGIKASSDTNIKSLELSKGKLLDTEHHYFDTNSKDFCAANIKEALSKMKEAGCQVIVASEAFGVDNTENEDTVVSLALGQELLSTASHEISQLYGLKVRTRTAVINASILPKMTETANLTDQSIRKSGIESPLMIMRSDGGVMDLNQMRKRPILTMLSGPAAGIAAALMFAKISDGIFLEVGGTSTDISAIKNGKAMIKSANVGGHITYLKTLDSRTVGVGGGSMTRMKHQDVLEVGPRSAHIAGLGYLAFSTPQELEGAKPVLFSPMPSDPGDYLGVENKEGKRFAVTLTDASILMNMTREGDYAYGNYDQVKRAFDVIGSHFGKTGEQIAQQILDGAAAKVKPVVLDLLEEYRIDAELVSLVGGGGGATSVVPWLSQKVGMKYLIAPKAEVISAIGAALAMLRDTVEKTVMTPTESDILAIKKDAFSRLVSMGADVNTIEVQIEIDQGKNILRAIATGAFEMDQDYHTMQKLEEPEIRKSAAESLKTDADRIQLAAVVDGLYIYEDIAEQRRLFGLLKTQIKRYRVLDAFGVVKFQTNAGDIFSQPRKDYQKTIKAFIERVSDFSDVGITLAQFFLIYKNRIVDYSSVLNYEQLLNLIELELEGLSDHDRVVVISSKR
ncbi:N-methylhydantoinase A/oxoprolinase/acetone carboxylase beta subunit [Anaerotaenia torta]|uniref:hydantoinase/oxoprolinase family protein n=1 Tax=Anaerotaenia torta TaxID=433293 RepID=UPI003D1B27D1